MQPRRWYTRCGTNHMLQAVVAAVVAYASIVVLLRVFGKRTLAKMNAFDFVVTIALGSALASTIASPNSVPRGLVTMAALIILQFAVAWTSVRSRAFRRFARSEPALLVFEGKMIADAMRSERVARDSLLQALRRHGKLSVSDVYAVVLETDGSISVLPWPDRGVRPETLDGVRRRQTETE